MYPQANYPHSFFHGTYLTENLSHLSAHLIRQLVVPSLSSIISLKARTTVASCNSCCAEASSYRRHDLTGFISAVIANSAAQRSQANVGSRSCTAFSVAGCSPEGSILSIMVYSKQFRNCSLYRFPASVPNSFLSQNLLGSVSHQHIFVNQSRSNSGCANAHSVWLQSAICSLGGRLWKSDAHFYIGRI
jgi:hypothetical protein